MRSFRKRFVLSVAAGSALASAGLAQAPGAPGMPANATHMRSSEDQAGPIVSVDFKGGPLVEFVGALRAATKEPVNISLQGGADQIPVSPLSLRNVSVDTALQAALGPRIGQAQTNPNGTASYIRFNEIDGGGGGLPVYSVSVQGEMMSRRNDRVEVLSILSLITGEDKVAPDVILTAIDTGLGLDRDRNSPPPQIKFHADSGLILVRGEPGDVGLASEIVSRMFSDHGRKTAESRRRRAAEIERNAAMARSQLQLHMSEGELKIAASQADRMRQLAEKGQAPHEELEAAEMRQSHAAANRDMAKIEIERLEQLATAGMFEEGSGGQGDGDPRDQKIRALEQRVQELEAELGKARDQGGAKRPAR